MNSKEKMYARVCAEKAKGSTAERYDFSMKAVEAIIREAVYKRMKAADYRARSAGKADLYLYINGKRAKAEVKCGGTILSNAPLDWDEDDLFADAPYIVFPVITEIHDEDDVLDNSLIFTREEFLSICESASRKGIASTFHITAVKTGHPVVAFQPAPLNRVRETVWKMILNGDGLTVRQYAYDRDAEA